MRRIGILFGLFFTFCFCARGQSTFNKFYKGINPNNYGGWWGETVIKTHDGGYACLGLSNGIYLIKTDSLGDTLWTKKYDAPGWEESYRLSQNSDSGFCFGGRIDTVAFIIRTNSKGDTLWKRQFSSSGSPYIHAIKQTSDGGFIAAGALQISSVNMDFFLIKLDASGNTQWLKTYGGIYIENAPFVLEIPGSGYILSGISSGTNTYIGDNFCALRTDLNGNLLWTKIYGGARNDIPHEMAMTNDGGFVIVGSSDSFQNSDGIYIIKIDSTGNLVWAKDYDCMPNDAAFSVAITNDNGFIIAGGFGSNSSECSFLLKLNPLGDTNWITVVDTFYAAFSVVQANDKSYVTLASKCGSTWCGSALIKADSLGRSCFNKHPPISILTTTTTVTPLAAATSTWTFTTASLQLIIKKGDSVITECGPVGIEVTQRYNEQFRIFPNPFFDKAELKMNSEIMNSEIAIYNSVGQKVKELDISIEKFVIHRDDLPPGVYLILIRRNGLVLNVQKVVISDN